MKAGGKGGRLFNDRQLSAEVREMGLGYLKKVLDPKYKDKEFQKQVMLRIAPALLPRLNEHTGEDGKAIVIQVAKEIALQNGVKIDGITS